MGGVELEVEDSAGGEESLGVAGDGAVEEKRVVVGDEEGEMWLVVEHVAVHRSGLAPADIGRIAHDDILGRDGWSSGGENVVEEESHLVGIWHCAAICLYVIIAIY